MVVSPFSHLDCFCHSMGSVEILNGLDRSNDGRDLQMRNLLK